ncbi:Imm7 family immunity protein [Streptomyces sp. NPDC001698]|uniref:Imm7 family immunity protein n=1 Tax=Streptomyces sp. NPDC001698 TaxID=3364601 RepID=UPI00369F988F
MVAPGSYGLLHVRDDEEPGHENEVRVLRLVRGVIHAAHGGSAVSVYPDAGRLLLRLRRFRRIMFGARAGSRPP